MTAQPISALHANDFDANGSPETLDSSGSDGAAEPVRPAEAQRRQVMSLALPPSTLAWIGGVIGATLLGGGIGYWLGSRRRPQPARPVRHFAATLDSAADLAPVALRLMSNPIVRTIVLRQIAKQVARRVAS